MGLQESEKDGPQGLFDNNEVICRYQALREEAARSEQIRGIVQRIENAGPIMVIDPEEALSDLDATLERVRIASRMGMEIIEVGGSTNKNNAAEIVIPQIRDAVREVGGDTLLISFPGTSDQVVTGVGATFSLFLPQLDGVFRSSPQAAQYFIGEYINVIRRSMQLDVPIIPVTYIIFNAGKKTTVESKTGIDAISVVGGVDTELIMRTITPWLDFNDLVMLEMGSGPETSVNLGPVAERVCEVTGVLPIVTGGVNDPELMEAITSHILCPVVFGSIAERTPPEQFEALYMRFRESHPSCQTMLRG